MYGVIFDMDGVLIDSARPHFESWRRLGEELGQDVTEEQFWPTFGRQNRDIIPIYFDITEPQRVEQLSERKEELYRALIREHVPGIDGAVELVRDLHDAGFKLAIGSSGPPENVDLVLAGMGIEESFDVRITSRQVSRGKPDPQVFQLAADGLGLSNRNCAVIEDAPAGVEAALAAGSVAVALTGGHDRDALGAAHLVVDSLRELSPDRITRIIDDGALA